MPMKELITIKIVLILRKLKIKMLKNNHDWQFSCVMIKIAPIFDSFISKFISMCY